MVKAKKTKKHGGSDKLYDKKFIKPVKKLNPFEVHINKEKFSVLNRKTTCDRGMPFASRAKAIEKRKETLGNEYNLQHKSNSFKDKRRDPEQQRHRAAKESIYNLNESEVLTHRGQTLAEIERCDEPVDDEDNLSDEEQRLDGKLWFRLKF